MVLDAIFEGVDPVTKITFVVSGGLVIFKMSTVKVEKGLAQDPLMAFTFI